MNTTQNGTVKKLLCWNDHHTKNHEENAEICMCSFSPLHNRSFNNLLLSRIKYVDPNNETDMLAIPQNCNIN